MTEIVIENIDYTKRKCSYCNKISDKICIMARWTRLKIITCCNKCYLKKWSSL